MSTQPSYVEQLVMDSLRKAEADVRQEKIAAAVVDPPPEQGGPTLEAQSTKLAETLRALAEGDLEVLFEKGAKGPDTGTADPSVQPPTDEDKSTSEEQKKETVPPNEHTAQKGPKTRPDDNESRKHDVNEKNNVAPVLKTSGESEGGDEGEEKIALSPTALKALLASGGAAAGAAGGAAIAPEDRELLGALIGGAGGAGAGALSPAAVRALRGRLGQGGDDIALNLGQGDVMGGLSTKLSEDAAFQGIARCCGVIKEAGEIPAAEKLAEAADVEVEFAQAVIEKIADASKEAATDTMAGAGTSTENKPPESESDSGHRAAGTGDRIPFVGDKAALVAFKKRQAKTLSNKEVLDGVLETPMEGSLDAEFGSSKA